MKNSQPLRIYVLIDALGWRILEGREFLSDVLPYRAPLRTVLGFSSGAIPTMLTGVPPAENGHWNLFYYDPKGSPFRWFRPFRFLPKAIVENRVARKIMKELGRRVLGLGPLFECCVSPRLLPYFNWVEKRNIYDRGGIGGASSIFDQLAERNVPYRVYSYHESSDAEILRHAQADVEAGAANFYFLYLSEADSLLHKYPEGGKELDEQLAEYATGLRKVFDAARKQDSRASFTIVSDHGMAPVRHRFDLVKEVEDLGLRMPDDYLAVYDSTMARFWFFSERGRREITARLNGLDCARILPDEELEQLGIFFPDRRYGETIALLNPGWLVSKGDFNGPGWNPAGMHGYHPDDPYSDAIFLSSQAPNAPVHSIADVYRCMHEAVA